MCLMLLHVFCFYMLFAHSTHFTALGGLRDIIHVGVLEMNEISEIRQIRISHLTNFGNLINLTDLSNFGGI